MEICNFFRCIVNTLIKETSMILSYEIIVDDFQHAIRDNEYEFGMQGNDRFNLF